MSVAFPSGYALSRKTTFARDPSIAVDYLEDGTPRTREIGGVAWVVIQCEIEYITKAERDTLTAFLFSNRSSEITWTIDGTSYTGRIISGVEEKITGNRYSLSFTYRARAA